MDKYPGLADWKETYEELRQFSEDQALLDRRFDELVRNHRGSWVAARRGKLFIARSFKDLRKRIGPSIASAAVKHLLRDPQTLILPCFVS